MNNERKLLPLNRVKKERVRWFWRNRIPLGALTIVDGDPGQGKSTLLYDLAARVTSGRPMPGCTRGTNPAGVVVIQAEDSVPALVKPTLRAMGADLRLVRAYDKREFGDRPLVLPADLSLIEAAAAEVNAKLVIVDPLDAFLEGPTNSNTKVRAALAPLASYAERAGLAIIIARHLTKDSRANALYRGTGSIGIIALARSALIVVTDPASEDGYQHLLFATKANIATAPVMGYRTAKQREYTIVEWLGEQQCAAAGLAGSGRVDHSKLGEAVEVLFLILKTGPVAANEAIKKATESGIARRTLDRAKAQLDVITFRKEGGWSWLWMWRLPPEGNEIVRRLEERYASTENQTPKAKLIVPPGIRGIHVSPPPVDAGSVHQPEGQQSGV
jgi:hypothetical protein